MLKDQLIHSLGGYTKKEYERVQQKYQALLDSKTSNDSISICNEYLWRMLRDLDEYARSLFGLLPDAWSHKMYNVIHNNWLRMTARYINTDSAVIYRLDTTLDQEDQFANILKEDSKYLNK